MPFEFETLLNEQLLLLFVFSYPQGSTIQEVNWPGPLNEGFRPEYDAIRALGVCTHMHSQAGALYVGTARCSIHTFTEQHIPSVLDILICGQSSNAS